MLLLAAVIWTGGEALYRRPGPLPHATPIVIQHGSLAATAAILQREGALRPGRFGRLEFRVATRLSGSAGPIHAGEFAFPARASIRDVLLVLRRSAPVQHQLTIPEGLTASQIAFLVMRDPSLAGPFAVPQEGAILPETYAYALGTARASLIGRMRQAMEGRLAAIWARRDPGLMLSRPGDLLRLASIVERETAVAAERPLVARVFLNRLRLGMRLQSDPTVSFAASGGLGTLGRPLSRADLALASPFNTYAVAGLPPTPICAPGTASLEAVAHPAVSDALYFVADGHGGHLFAVELADHERNVSRLRALQAARSLP